MPGPIFLEGQNVTLRPAGREDVEFIQRGMNDPAVWRPALGADPVTDADAEEFFETVLSDTDGVHCLVCVDADPVGLVSLTASRHGPDETERSRAAELGFWIDPDRRRSGYGSDAVARTVRYAFEDRNLRRVGARLGSFNAASAGLLESLGFEHEGTLREAAWYRGAYHDVLRYGLLRADWRKGS